MRSLVVVVLTLAPVVATTDGQVPVVRPIPPNERPATTARPLVDAVQGPYDTMKGSLVAAAAAMPAADYTFRPAVPPSPDHAPVRTFGQVIARLASDNYLFCAAAEGHPAPAGTAAFETTKTSRADLTQALTASFDYCDRVWAGTTDQNATAPASAPAGLPLPAMTRLGALVTMTAHDAEHYGTLATYLRAKGLVPPSSPPHR